MVRFFGILIGLFFAGMLIYSFARGAVEYISNPPVKAVEYQFHEGPKDVPLQATDPLANLTTNSSSTVSRSIKKSVLRAMAFVWLRSAILPNLVITKMK